MKEIDHECTESVVCPYCGTEYVDCSGWAPSGTEECCDCGKKFTWERQFEMNYTTKKYHRKNWSQMRLERDDNGLLTPLALTLNAISDYGCDCGTDEPGTCLCCLCENALRDQWEQLNGYRKGERIGK